MHVQSGSYARARQPDASTFDRSCARSSLAIAFGGGSVIRNIHLIEDDDDNIEGTADKIKGLVLKTCFLKKA